MIWWSEGYDQYLPKYQNEFKSNVLAILLKDMADIGSYSTMISLGIERRLLGDENSRTAAHMIWKNFANKLNLEFNEHDG